MTINGPSALGPVGVSSVEVGVAKGVPAAGGLGVRGSSSAGQAPPQAPATGSGLDGLIQAAASNQGGLSALLADLAAALQSPDLPPSVQGAAAEVLEFQLPLDPPPTAADLSLAVAQSGLFLEADLAQGNAPAYGDFKSTLLTLFQALETTTGGAAGATASATVRPAPPYVGAPTQAQPAIASLLSAEMPAEQVAGRLTKATSAAISRQVLMQLASASNTTQTAGGSRVAHWLFELPFATDDGASVAQFEIDRDGGSGPDEEDQTWRAGFSLAVGEGGPVHAKIVLKGGRLRVAMWAESGETLQRLTEDKAEMANALQADGLEAEVSVFPGAPAPETPPKAGRFMDRAI